MCGPCAGDFDFFEKIPVLENFQIPCVCVSRAGDFDFLGKIPVLENFQIPCVCPTFFETVVEAPVLGTLKPVCGLCAVVCGDFENFQISPACGLCIVVCRDFEYLQSSPVCGLCTVWCV